LEKRNLAHDILNDKLHKLCEFNPKFGRILIIKTVREYNLAYPKFTMKNAIYDYLLDI